MRILILLCLVMILLAPWTMLRSQTDDNSDGVTMEESSSPGAEIEAGDRIPQLFIFLGCALICLILYYHMLASSFVHKLEKDLPPLHSASSTLLLYVIFCSLIMLIWASNLPNMFWTSPLEVFMRIWYRVAILVLVALGLAALIAPHKKTVSQQS